MLHGASAPTPPPIWALAQRLETLALPPVPGDPSPPGDRRSWSPGAFAPAGGRCAAQPSLSAVEVAGNDVVLREAGTAVRFRMGLGTWAVSEPSPGTGEPAVPVAVSGGWVEASTLRFDVMFLETPHRLLVTCDRDTGTFDATWATPPLQPLELRELHAPRTPTTLRTGSPVEPGP